MPQTDQALQAPTVDNRVLAEQVYDTLMIEIEPELLLANIPLLDAQYASESKDEHAARMKRYAAAYKKFDAKLAEFMNEVDTNVRVSQRVVRTEREQEDRTHEEDKLNSIASAFA